VVIKRIANPQNVSLTRPTPNREQNVVFGCGGILFTKRPATTVQGASHAEWLEIRRSVGMSFKENTNRAGAVDFPSCRGHWSAGRGALDLPSAVFTKLQSHRVGMAPQ
jgi:hypothetical protein